MPAHFRLTTELPSDPTQRTHAVAKAFGLAFHEAVTSPDFRIEMILGEAYARYSEVVSWLVGEIEKETPAVQAHARALVRGKQYSIKAIHEAMLVDAVLQSVLTESARE
jgi:hypothetical protein